MSNTMSGKRDVETIKSGVSFENYLNAKKALEAHGRRVDVLIKDGIASFRTGNKRFRYVCGEEDGELHCVHNLDPLNKFSDSGLKDVNFKFSNESKTIYSQ